MLSNHKNFVEDQIHRNQLIVEMFIKFVRSNSEVFACAGERLDTNFGEQYVKDRMYREYTQMCIDCDDEQRRQDLRDEYHELSNRIDIDMRMLVHRLEQAVDVVFTNLFKGCDSSDLNASDIEIACDFILLAWLLLDRDANEYDLKLTSLQEIPWRNDFFELNIQSDLDPQLCRLHMRDKLLWRHGEWLDYFRHAFELLEQNHPSHNQDTDSSMGDGVRLLGGDVSVKLETSKPEKRQPGAKSLKVSDPVEYNRRIEMFEKVVEGRRLEDVTVRWLEKAFCAECKLDKSEAQAIAAWCMRNKIPDNFMFQSDRDKVNQ